MALVDAPSSDSDSSLRNALLHYIIAFPLVLKVRNTSIPVGMSVTQGQNSSMVVGIPSILDSFSMMILKGDW